MSQASTSCPLDWDRRAGFLATTRVLEVTRHWYLIAHYANETRRGEPVDMYVNSKGHIGDLHLMPQGSGDELLWIYGMGRAALGLADGASSNFGANIGGSAAGAKITGHLHINVLGAPGDDEPCAGMGLKTLRKVYNNLSALLAASLDDLVRLESDPTVSVEAYRVRIAYWNSKRSEFIKDQRDQDAYRR